MQVTTATSHTGAVRSYSIEDEAEGFQLLLFIGDEQIGGGYFPDLDGTGAVFHIAFALGESFVASVRPRSAGLS